MYIYVGISNSYFIIYFRSIEGSSKWYKFDDGDVTECKMDEDEEMKTQCFGGDYMGEVNFVLLFSLNNKLFINFLFLYFRFLTMH